MTTPLATRNRLDVLLIDDSEDDRAAYRDVLTESGFFVREVDDPLSGYEQAVRDLPSIIVADIRMPGILDGIELTRKLKVNTATRAIPIIVLTAYADDETRTEALRAGAALFFIKPCAPDVLLAAIRRLLASPNSSGEPLDPAHSSG
jgi:CheY-like chemotaxis protein